MGRQKKPISKKQFLKTDKRIKQKAFRQKAPDSLQRSHKNKFIAQLEKSDQHLVASEKYAFDLSQRISAINEQLKDAEFRETECGKLVRQAEERVDKLSRDHAEVKRKLMSLYSSLVSSIPSERRLGEPAKQRNIHSIPVHVIWRIFIMNSVITTSDERLIKSFTRNILEVAETKSQAKNTLAPIVVNTESSRSTERESVLDPFTPLCPYSLTGICNDHNCPFQHLSNGQSISNSSTGSHKNRERGSASTSVTVAGEAATSTRSSLNFKREMKRKQSECLKYIRLQMKYQKKSSPDPDPLPLPSLTTIPHSYEPMLQLPLQSVPGTNNTDSLPSLSLMAASGNQRYYDELPGLSGSINGLDWRSYLQRVLRQLLISNSSSSSTNTSSAFTASRSQSKLLFAGDPIGSIVQLMLRRKVANPNKWTAKALQALCQCLEHPDCRTDKQLWLVHLALLPHVDPQDRPEIQVFQTYLLDETFPGCWLVYHSLLSTLGPQKRESWVTQTVTEEARRMSEAGRTYDTGGLSSGEDVVDGEDSDDDNSTAGAGGGDNGNISVEDPLEDEEGADAMSESDGEEGESDGLEKGDDNEHSQAEPTVPGGGGLEPSHRVEVAPYFGFAWLEYLEHICLSGQEALVINALCDILNTEFVFNEEDLQVEAVALCSSNSQDHGANLSSVTHIMKSYVERVGDTTVVADDDAGQGIATSLKTYKSVLWSTLLVLLVTGRWEGGRILLLVHAGETYIPSGEWGEVVTRLKELVRRQPVFQEALRRILTQALSDVSEEVQRGAERVAVNTDRPLPAQTVVYASIQAICWCAVIFSSVWESLHLEYEFATLSTAWTIFCPPFDFPYLYPPAAMIPLYENPSREGVDVDQNSLMTVTCLLYLSDKGNDVGVESERFAIQVKEYLDVTSGPESVSSISGDSDLKELETWFWGIDKELQSIGTIQRLCLWTIIGERIGVFGSASCEQLSALIFRIILRMVHVPLQIIYLFVQALVVNRLRVASTGDATAARGSFGSREALVQATRMEMLGLVIDAIEFSFNLLATYGASPGDRVDSTLSNVGRTSLCYALDVYDKLGLIPAHRLLLDVLEVLGELDLDETEVLLTRSLRLLPSPDIVLPFLLKRVESHAPSHTSYCRGLSTLLSTSLPAHVFNRFQPSICWDLVQLMTVTERYEMVHQIRESLKVSSKSNARYFLALVDEYIHFPGNDKLTRQSNKSTVLASRDRGQDSGDADLNQATSPLAILRWCHLKEGMDLCQLGDTTLARLYRTCVDSIASKGKEQPMTVVADFNASFVRADSASAVPTSLLLADRVTELNLEHNSLAAIPTQVLHMHNLVRLNLSWNSLTSLPIGFSASCPRISILNLSYNMFVHFPTTITHLQHLKELYLNNNLLEYLPPQLTNMTELKVLDLSENSLKVLPAGLSQNMKLQFLKISGNPACTFVR